MNQPRDANGCFSKRALPKGSSVSGADGSSSVVRASASEGFTERQGPARIHFRHCKLLQCYNVFKRPGRHQKWRAPVIAPFIFNLGPW